MRPEWSGRTTERNFVLPAVVILVLIAAAAYAGYYFTRPTVTYAISSDTFSRLNRTGKDLALRLNAEPCNRDVAARLAKVLTDGSEYAATISFVTYTERKCGENEFLWVPLAEAQRGSSDYAAAEETVNRGIALHSNSNYAYFLRADLRVALGNFEGAYDDYKKAIYIYSDPAYPGSGAFESMAKAAAKLGRLCEANSVIHDFMALHSDEKLQPSLTALMQEWRTKGKCPKLVGSGKTRLAYDRRAGGILLPVTINNVSGIFIIDTGASRTAITKSFAKKAGIEPSEADGGKVTTANGVVAVLGGRADEIVLGNARSKNVPLFIQTEGKGFGRGVDGLLGLSFLGNFKFMLNNGVLELTPLN